MRKIPNFDPGPTDWDYLAPEPEDDDELEAAQRPDDAVMAMWFRYAAS